jgi:predicted NBD/HSP70 family sugar kinase
MVELDRAEPLRIAACIGGTGISLAVLDSAFDLIEKRSIPTEAGGALMEASRTAADRPAFTSRHWNDFIPHRKKMLDDLGEALREMTDKIARSGRKVKGIGISAPGAIHPRTGEVIGLYGGMNLPAWGDFNLKNEIETRTRIATTAINDAKAMALGALARMHLNTMEWSQERPGAPWREERLGEAGRSVRTFIELDPGTGLGGAYIVDGRLWFGPEPDDPDPDVGEIWKLDITPREKGTNLEEQASGRVTMRRLAARIEREAGDEGRALVAGSGGRIQEMLRTAPSGILPIIEEEVARTGRYLGMGIRLLLTSEQKRLAAPDIRTFMIGGGPVSGEEPSSRSMRRLIHTGILQELEGEEKLPRILFTTLGSKAGIYGSAALLDS